MRRRLRFLRTEDGQALAELALVAPLFVLLILAMVDFGGAVNSWNDENHLASLGARYASVGNFPPCSGTTYVDLVPYLKCEAGRESPQLNCTPSCGSTGIQSPGVAVCVSVPVNAVGNDVTVKVSATYNWLPMPKALGVGGSLAPIPLSGSATMRLEGPVPSGWTTQTAAC